ncbi:GNAT family N-acetyltransferase [Ornithinibacillus sp. L9]|uniref:GNAT family N-acetyltransferase n=1 Tax=Ornithinibacillus caprae TaxID=2678566 RepID=A0A6N8FKR8_9BACI|nr:GNAT family N-acetyltransferase [Ornithinibacillus caprae]MUK89761.1 GNAT family N-acetyltransferase [Ornithinibacillus caprae]
MEWNIKEFNELPNDELYELLKARIDVFVVEQNCPYPELDNYDQQSLHYYLKVNNEIAAIVRLLPKGLKYKNAASIGRVMVVKKFRGNGYAKELMLKAIDYISNEWGTDKIKIQAQVYLREFYGSLGFEQISEEYLEDDIPHIDMLRIRK